MESPTHEMTSADQHTSSPASSDVAAQSQAQSNKTSETTAGDAKTNITAASSKQKLTDLWGLGSDDDTARPLPKIKKKKTIESRQAAANNPNNQTFTPEATPPSPAENRKTETNKRNSDAIDIQIPDTEFVLDNDPEKRLEEEEQRFERQFNQARRPPQQAGSIKLGELLTMSGFIEESDINQAIELGRQHPALLGKMLVSSGAIEEGALLSALRCQFLMRNGHIQVEDAVKALQLARTNRISLDDALDELDVPIPMPKESNQ
jgi:hypothetical protein